MIIIYFIHNSRINDHEQQQQQNSVFFMIVSLLYLRRLEKKTEEKMILFSEEGMWLEYGKYPAWLITNIYQSANIV